jgi:hypothetical protein
MILNISQFIFPLFGLFSSLKVLHDFLIKSKFNLKLRLKWVLVLSG